MPGVKPAIYLVAQRQALLELEAVNNSYTEILQGWEAMLSPTEADALRYYDRMVETFKVTAAPPANVPDNIH